MPEVTADRHERMLFSFQPVSAEPNRKFGIFAAPSHKVLIKPVDGEYVFSEKPHIATSYSAQPGYGIGGEKRHSYEVMAV
jgi:hypothetical protein